MKSVEFLRANGVDVDKSLEMFGTIEKYDIIASKFLDSIDEKIAELKSYKEASDMQNYMVLVHSLKSEAGYLGFLLLNEMAQNHENAAKERNLEYVFANFDDLIHEANRVVEILKNYFGGEETVVAVKAVNTVVGGKSILVVDDSDLMRNFINSIFSSEYEVLEAKNGLEALEFISNKDKNIIGMLLDLEMPGVDGFFVLDELESKNLFSTLPVCIITGTDVDLSKFYLDQFPIMNIMKKPFSEEEVKEQIRKFEETNNNSQV